MTLSLPREEALRTIKSQQTSSVWVWRSHYGLTDPIQFTSSMDSTRSENRQPGVINGTPTVKPAFQSSSGRGNKKGKSEEKDISVQVAHGNGSDCLHCDRGRHPTRKARQGREKQEILKLKARSKKRKTNKRKNGRWGQGWGAKEVRQAEGNSKICHHFFYIG